MKERTYEDKIFKEVRMQAIKNAYIPESIRSQYTVKINEETEKIIIGKKPGKK